MKTSDILRSYEERDRAIKNISYAIPCNEAIECLVSLSPIVEIGAGTGYWASLIAKAGGDIICYDDYSLSAIEHGKYYKVNMGDPEAVKLHSDRTLFLCWTQYDTNMAYQSLFHYTGHSLCLISEGYGGCCGNDAFFENLEENWKQVNRIEIPQWSGIHDYLAIYKRT